MPSQHRTAKPGPAPKPGARRRHRLLALTAATLLVALGAYLVALDQRVARRLGGDSTRTHTRFFSSPFRIVRGMDIDRVALLERLAQLGYRADPDLSQAGTWHRRAGALEIRLRALADPELTLPERLTRIALDGSRVAAIIDVPTGSERTQATLEPALLDVTWNGAWARHRPVRLAALPKHVPFAILAAEDARFYQHGALDPRGVLRAVWVDLRERRLAEGASTIAQQLAKNFFLTPARTWRRKAQEALIAALLEHRLSKDEILELYLNEVYLGRAGAANVIGIGEAARTFFGKSAEQLTAGEAATIAGLIRAPNSNSPLRSPERARRRRNAVLQRMVRAGFLTAEEAAAAKRAPLETAKTSEATVEGLFFLEQVRREVESRLGEDAVLDEGLDVYTTLDPLMQRHAERGVAQALAALENAYRWLRGRKTVLEGAHVVVDTRDGAVRALVGGRDFARRPFDRAVTARRQAGSTFKPFVYLAAFQALPDTVTPSMLLDDSPLAIGAGTQTWKPANYDERFRGPVTVRTALESSLNVPTVRLSQLVGVDGVARITAAAGWHGDLPRVPALALGVAETSLLDLAGAYTLFPRMGMPAAPHVLRGVVGAHGTTRYRWEPSPQPGADTRAAYLVHHLLEGVVDRGTARALRRKGFTGALAGKTGTTNDYRDAWFVGYSADLVGAAWVGFDDGRPLRLSGAATALELWAAVMRPILNGQPPHAFAVPEGIVFRDVDPATGLLPAFACPRTIREAFLAGTEPHEHCGERPDLLEAEGGFEEPLRAPARIIGDWVRQAMRVLGAGSPGRLHEREEAEQRRGETPRRRYPAEIDEERRQPGALDDREKWPGKAD